MFNSHFIQFVFDEHSALRSDELHRVNANFTAVPGLRAEQWRAFPEYSIADEFSG
jgi:hypothetical protein